MASPDLVSVPDTTVVVPEPRKSEVKAVTPVTDGRHRSVAGVREDANTRAVDTVRIGP
jgi:hypothetical protein